MMLNQGMTTADTEALAEKLSAKQLIQLGKLERDNYLRSMPDGKQITETPPNPTADELPPIKTEDGLRNIMEGLK